MTQNDITLVDGDKIVCIVRLDAGDGPISHPYRPYAVVTSEDGGFTWSKAETLPPQVGCARPRLLSTASGAIVLSGGRLTGRNRDIFLWIGGDSLKDWEAFSVTYRHNLLVNDS